MPDPSTSNGTTHWFKRHPVRWSLVALAVLLALRAVVGVITPTEVRTVALETRDVTRTLVLVGRARPPSRAALGTTVPGIVRSVEVREGDRVVRGDALILLDDREARAALSQAQAALNEVGASVQANIEQLEINAAQTARDLERVRSVFEVGARTQRQLEQAEQEAADARSRLQAALANPDGAGNASVLRARSAVDVAQARLILTRVSAPASGTVLTRSVEPGDAVQPGRTLLELGTDGPTEIVVFPSEENLEQLQLGASAEASPDAYPDSAFSATLSFIAPSVDPDQGTIEVRLSIDDPPSYLLPDMTLSVNIEGARRDGATVLAADAVRGLGTAEPWVAVIREGRIERQPIDVGVRGNRFIEVRSGLSDTDKIVPETESPEIGTRVRASAND